MASRLKGLINTFGLLEGLGIYSRIKLKKSGRIDLHKYNASFYLRPKTSDLFTFDQVFIKQQYKIQLPFKPLTIVDAGANIGLSAAYFAITYPAAQIIAIEPEERNFEQLLKNIAPYKNITPLQKGLWNQETFVKITNLDDHVNSFMVQEDAENTNGISTVSLQAIMEQNKWETIDILKIDIEGSEKDVFEENTDYWLPKTKSIFVETHDRMRKGSTDAVLNALKKYNFSFSTIDENLVFINRDL